MGCNQKFSPLDFIRFGSLYLTLVETMREEIGIGSDQSMENAIIVTHSEKGPHALLVASDGLAFHLKVANQKGPKI